MTEKTVHPADHVVQSGDIQLISDINALTDPLNYVTVKHVYCLAGELSLMLDARSFVLHQGEVLMLLFNQVPTNLVPSADFKMRGVLFSEHLLRATLPAAKYGTQMLLALTSNPILPTTPYEQTLCLRVLDAIRERLEYTTHSFYFDVLRYTVQTFFLDHYNILARCQQTQHKQFTQYSKLAQAPQIFYNFIKMIERGDYKDHRDLAYYAAELCITKKYLSEICSKISGRTATFWIDLFTIIEISRMLNDTDMTIGEMVSELHFSSVSYFSHYVKAHLKMSPQEYRTRYIGPH